MGLLARLNRTTSFQAKTTGPAVTTVKNRFRGVEIIPRGNDCCEAAKALTGKRFLSHEVPKLPLNECDADSCSCGFERYDDRRTDLRRDADVGCGTAGQFYTDENRRSRSTGRREED